MQVMGHGFEREYVPDGGKVPLYEERYRGYQRIGRFLEDVEGAG